MIAVKQLQKSFSIRRPEKGLAALRSLIRPRYRVVKAVDEISFEVAAGELVGFLGPNGAGKSTTMKMLTGLLVPSGGELHVNGYLPWRDRRSYVATIGAVFGQRSTLWWDLPLQESLSLLQHIYQVPKARFKTNLAEFSELLALDAFLDAPVRTLSLGQRMRADICAALMHDPQIVFLDEPTIGLDVVAKEHIRQFIQRINETKGTTILLTTHDLADVKKLCKRVMIIDQGKLIFDGSLAALLERFGNKRRLIVDFAESYQQLDLPEVELIEHQGRRAVYQFDRDKQSASELIRQLSERFQIQDLSVEEPDIEPTIREIYEGRRLD